jgi:hypothetical protein
VLELQQVLTEFANGFVTGKTHAPSLILSGMHDWVEIHPGASTWIDRLLVGFAWFHFREANLCNSSELLCTLRCFTKLTVWLMQSSSSKVGQAGKN